jgi:hypothetical protein
MSLLLWHRPEPTTQAQCGLVDVNDCTYIITLLVVWIITIISSQPRDVHYWTYNSPKVLHDNRSCAVLIQRLPATITSSAVYLVGAYQRCVSRYAFAIRGPVRLNGRQSSSQWSLPNTT